MLQLLVNCSVSPSSSSFLLTTTTRNELARLGMGTIFLVIGERSEPLSREFNDQPHDIYIWWCPYVRTNCELLFLQTQALLTDYSTNVCHTCPLTYNDSYKPFKVERKFEFILENASGGPLVRNVF